MLRNKFGIPPERVCAGFLHGRIQGLAATKAKGVRGETLGYLEGGLDRLARRLGWELAQRGRVLLGTPAQALEQTSGGWLVHARGRVHPARVVVNTLPLNYFARLPLNFSFTSPVKYQGWSAPSWLWTGPWICPTGPTSWSPASPARWW